MKTIVIDKINNLYLDYIQTHDLSDLTNPELFIFNKLIGFIRDGNYTNRRNKQVILNSWQKYSNKELAELLNVSVSAISYTKRDINFDLTNSLGAGVTELIKDKRFAELNDLIDRESFYLAQDLLLPPSLLKTINCTYETESEELKNLKSDVIYELENQLTKAPTDRLPTVNQALHFIHQLFLPRLNQTLEYFDIEYLKGLIDILLGNRGTPEARHALLDLLNTPSTFEENIKISYMSNFWDNFQ